MLQDSIYSKALCNAIPDLRTRLEKPGRQGLEKILRDHLAKLLGERADKEVHYNEFDGKRLCGQDSKRASIDILIDKEFGLELKVVEFPRKTKTSPSAALYDIGQISADYVDISKAKKLKRGQIVLLLTGCLVKELQTPIRVYRELHNRFFVDFMTSMFDGELKDELPKKDDLGEQRRNQVKVLKYLGFTEPHSTKISNPKVFIKEEFALCVIDVKKGIL